MNLIIVDSDAEYIKDKLTPKFPQVDIQAYHGEDEAGDAMEKADILLTKMISDELMQRGKNLKWIQCLITGVDYLVNLPSFKKDVILTSTRGIHGPQMSESAILLMLALNRNFPMNIRNQDQRVWQRWPTRLLYQKSVGILGVGVIGQEIARKCNAFGMTVYGLTSIKREIEFVDHSYGPEGLINVLREVDYFINVIPSTPQTINMIGEEELASMKPTAYYISIGRGDTVDEAALIRALEEKKIAGAAMDVFFTEPLPPDSPLWGMENVIITPHIGGMSDIYADQALPIFEENLRRYLRGERRDLINLIESIRTENRNERR
jgi:phosphoglycerate dehydrogenase-like enzyme